MPNYNLAFPYTTTNLILYLLTSQPMIEKSNSKSRCMWKLNVWNKLINPIQEKKCIFSNSWNLGYVSTFKEVKKPWWCSSMEQQWSEIFEGAFLFSCPFVLTRNIFNLSKKKTILFPIFFDPIHYENKFTKLMSFGIN